MEASGWHNGKKSTVLTIKVLKKFSILDFICPSLPLIKCKYNTILIVMLIIINVVLKPIKFYECKRFYKNIYFELKKMVSLKLRQYLHSVQISNKLVPMLFD